jgi:hypothetical protein
VDRHHLLLFAWPGQTAQGIIVERDEEWAQLEPCQRAVERPHAGPGTRSLDRAAPIARPGALAVTTVTSATIEPTDR